MPNLTRVTFDIRYAWYFDDRFLPPCALNWKAGMLPALLEPVADLNHLKRLDLRYNLVGGAMAFFKAFHATLVAMYSPLEALLQSGGFSSIRHFSTYVVLSNITGRWFEREMGEDKLTTAVLGLLPSLSSRGGRLEAEDGWLVDVEVDIAEDTPMDGPEETKQDT